MTIILFALFWNENKINKLIENELDIVTVFWNLAECLSFFSVLCKKFKFFVVNVWDCLSGFGFKQIIRIIFCWFIKNWRRVDKFLWHCSKKSGNFLILDWKLRFRHWKMNFGFDIQQIRNICNKIIAKLQ